MADIKWIKILTNIFSNEKIAIIDAMPEHDAIIVIWFKLLCLAGQQNNDGILSINGIPYSDEMLSAVFHRPINTVRLALQTFEQFGMIERINGTITIPNWGKYQAIDKMVEIREYNRIAQQRHRQQIKSVNDMSMTSQPCQDTDIDKDIDNSQSKSILISTQDACACACAREYPKYEFAMCEYAEYLYPQAFERKDGMRYPMIKVGYEFITDTIHRMFRYYSENGWKDESGNPILDWQSLLTKALKINEQEATNDRK